MKDEEDEGRERDENGGKEVQRERKEEKGDVRAL